jgi:putative Mg2+ transporter-C (MgtC) family protein
MIPLARAEATVRLDEHPVLVPVLRLALALLLALPLGWDRDQRRRSAGLRTYALLSVTVCGFLLVAQRTPGGPAEQADAFYGVLLGIGFVGSGAIVRSPQEARGLSAAVSLWVTGAIGAGVAYGNALLSTAVSLITVVAFGAPSLARRRNTTS